MQQIHRSDAASLKKRTKNVIHQIARCNKMVNLVLFLGSRGSWTRGCDSLMLSEGREASFSGDVDVTREERVNLSDSLTCDVQQNLK